MLAGVLACLLCAALCCIMVFLFFTADPSLVGLLADMMDGGNAAAAPASTAPVPAAPPAAASASFQFGAAAAPTFGGGAGMGSFGFGQAAAPQQQQQQPAAMGFGVPSSSQPPVFSSFGGQPSAGLAFGEPLL